MNWNKEKTKRANLLTQQHHICMMCNSRCETSKGMCYVSEQNAMICRTCQAYLSGYLHIVENKMLDVVAAFTKREPAPDPVVDPKTGEVDIPNDRPMYIDNEWCDGATCEPMVPQPKIPPYTLT